MDLNSDCSENLNLCFAVLQVVDFITFFQCSVLDVTPINNIQKSKYSIQTHFTNFVKFL